MTTTLIKNGKVISTTGVIAQDVLITDEVVTALGAPGYFAGAEDGAGKVIDAAGKYVIPGGIDVHTHMEMPFGGTLASDTFETGTRAAAWGGVTTIVDFAVQNTGGDVQDALANWHRKADGNCAIDYGFHQIIGGVDDQSLKSMKYLVDHEGITSFKLFMAYPGVLYSDDGQLLRAMQTAGEVGAMIMMHAENGIAIDVLVQQAVARGDTDPKFHSLTRPSPLEAEATHRAIVLGHVAGNVPLYIVHMSAGDALNEVAAARHHGRNVFAETCPQYLWLTLEETLGRPGFEGAKWVCSTPVRSRDHDPDYIGQMGHGHQGDLWKGLRMNELAVVSTDHCPFCMKDQKEIGLGNFAAIPNGIGGVEHRMELIYQGVVAGELSLERWVETCCTTPARMFGMYPQKGVVAPGSDADVVVWDPSSKTTIGMEGEGRKHHMNMDYSAWEGWIIDGKVDTVLSRGKVVIENDAYVGTKGHGRYVKRGLSQYLV
jgi:dihydropyrimidinase